MTHHNKLLYVLSVTVVVLLAIIAFSNTSALTAQTSFSGQRWEYREVVFTQPVTFDTSVAEGYFVDGRFTEATNPDGKVVNVFHWMGQQGWELTEATNSQVFFFKRPITQ